MQIRLESQEKTGFPPAQATTIPYIVLQHNNYLAYNKIHRVFRTGENIIHRKAVDPIKDTAEELLNWRSESPGHEEVAVHVCVEIGCQTLQSSMLR